MSHRAICASLFFAIAATAAPSVRAADNNKKACTDAYAQAQTLRDAHKLRAARDQMRICSQPTCKAFIVKDCTAWLLDVESRLPSVVLSAKDARGQPITDVTVSMDGTALAQKLDGDAIEVDPGQHTFTFVAGDGSKVDQPFTVLEGQKAQAVTATIATAASVAALKAEQDAAKAPPPPPDVPFWTTQRTLGAAAAGVGVAGIAVGSIFGLLTASAIGAQKTDCPSATNCPNYAQAASDHSTSSTDGTISTIAFVAGGVMLAGGAVLFLTAHGAEPATTGLVVVPSAGPGGAGMLLRGGF